MSKVFFLQGLPASGKSTWAKQYIKDHPNTKRINKDDLRAMIDAGVWSAENEKQIVKVRDMLLLSFLESGYDVIIDDTNLHQKHLVRIKQLVSKKHTVDVKQFFDVSIEECIKRDSDRPNPVGEKVIRSMANQFSNILNLRIANVKKEQKTWEKPYLRPHDPTLLNAFVFDIDGTLAHVVDRSPYDMTRVYEDTVDESMKAVVHAIQKAGYSILFVSGRNEEGKEGTIRWIEDKLEFHAYFHLFMRVIGDNRADYIIKTEIYERDIFPRYSVMAVFDDRAQVVKAIRKLGLPVYQVAEGNF